ncbi:MAG TPA: PDZ domain-containing protein [Gaiellaceae bacterium]|jgi:Lon-like protease|nr:PDZ domain-containing protein [Gaiellaceae bacterium]
MRWFSPGRLAASGLFLLAAAAFVLWLAPASGYDIRLVDPAHPADPLVTVPGEKPHHAPGPIYFVDVREREARLLERLFPFARADGSSLVPAPPIPSAVEQQIGVQDMVRSQKVAAVVALQHLGYKVRARSDGVTIVLVDPDAPASKVLRTSDVILSADGQKVTSVIRLRAVLAKHRPGDAVRITYRRDGKVRSAKIKTVADPQYPNRALIGVSARDALHVTLPVKIKIDAGGVGGPSAGLAFALDILEELGRDVTHGHKVAATGALDPDGTVGPIGGVKQKTLGVRRAGVDVFLVPAGANAREARRYADGLRIIPVKNFPQALRALATLPREG